MIFNLSETNTGGGGTPVINPLLVTANGTYTAPSGVDGYSPVTVNVSGGGGASNIVMGTFTTGDTGDSTGTVSLNYSGTGYPIALLVWVNGGAYNNTSSGDTTWYNSVNRYDAGVFSMTKARTTTAPTYETSGLDNSGAVTVTYKNSTSSATTYTSYTSMTANIFASSSSNGSARQLCCRFKGNGTTLAYYVGNRTASTIGLAQSTTFAYIVVYSS